MFWTVARVKSVAVLLVDSFPFVLLDWRICRQICITLIKCWIWSCTELIFSGLIIFFRAQAPCCSHSRLQIPSGAALGSSLRICTYKTSNSPENSIFNPLFPLHPSCLAPPVDICILGWKLAANYHWPSPSCVISSRLEHIKLIRSFFYVATIAVMDESAFTLPSRDAGDWETNRFSNWFRRFSVLSFHNTRGYGSAHMPSLIIRSSELRNCSAIHRSSHQGVTIVVIVLCLCVVSMCLMSDSLFFFTAEYK